MYLHVVVAVALLIQDHGLVGVALPLPVDDILVVVGARVQGHADAEEDFPGLPVLFGEVVIGLPFLPAALDDDVVGDVFAASLPDEAGFFCGAGAVVFAAAF